MTVATISVAAALAFALPVTLWSWRVSPQSWALDVSLHGFGVVCILLGYFAWLRLPASRVGPIIVGIGAAYHLQDLRVSRHPVIFGVGFSLAFVWVAVVGHLALAWPTGRVRHRGNRILLACAYTAAVATQALRLALDDPRPPLTYGTPYVPTPASRLGSVSGIVLILAVVAVTVRRWLTASGMRRRWRAPVWAAVLLLAVTSSAASVASLVHAPVRVENMLILISLTGALLFVPTVLLVRWSNARRARWRLARVVLDPGRADDLKMVQQSLANALGDPSLRVAYPVHDDRYVDVDGQPILPVVGLPGRAVTRVEQAGVLVALIEHDEALHEQQQVTTAVAEVAGVAIEIARMQATLRAQIMQIQTSRMRVFEAALEERRRIEQDLHDGAQQQFLAVLAILGLARDRLGTAGDGEIPVLRELVDRAHTQLRAAVRSLRELAQGIYPTALREYGLAAGVQAIADTSSIPIDVQVPVTRWPGHVEAAAYFFIAEAVTNATRHADATQLDIRVREVEEHLLIEVADDGRGGATSQPKSMADRVNTIGGSLSITSEPGTGTTVRARLPLESPNS